MLWLLTLWTHGKWGKQSPGRSIELHMKLHPIRMGRNFDILDIIIPFGTCFIIYIYMGVVLNKSSQEPPFRKSFASFRGPIRVAFSKIKNSYQDSNVWNQTNSNTNYTINRLLFARMNGSNQNVIVICCFFSLGPISGMAKCSPFWAGHGSSGYVFRASFARLSRTFRSKS